MFPMILYWMLFGASTLFSYTAHRSSDNTKTQIYLLPSLNLLLFFFTLSSPYPFFPPPPPYFFFLCAQGCKLIETAHQDLTDFTKCLAIMLQEIKSRQLQVNMHCTIHMNKRGLEFWCLLSANEKTSDS